MPPERSKLELDPERMRELGYRTVDALVDRLGDDELCDVSLCSGAHVGTWTYRDINHLTIAGSLLLTERFAGILRQAERS